jgi:ribokinase
MSSAQVIVVGSYVQDQTWFVDRFPRPGETLRANRYNTGPGGKGFNQAVACSRQGVRTAFIGALGKDTFATYAKKFAVDEKLECRWQIRNDQPTATAGITVNTDAENKITLILGANEHLNTDHVRAQNDLFASAKIMLIQLENNLDALAAALDVAEKHRLTRVFNPAPVHNDLDATMLRRADIVTPNEMEFSQLLERFANERIEPHAVAKSNDDALHALCRKLGVDTVIITLGSNGLFVSHGQNHRGDATDRYRMPAEKVNAIDTTGAGDAFSGALVAGMIRFEDQPFQRAVVHASRTAAIKTETVGAAPAIPSFNTVIERFGG